MSIKLWVAAAGLAIAAIAPASVSAQERHTRTTVIHRETRGGDVIRHDERRSVRHNVRRHRVCRTVWVNHRKVRRCR